MPKCSRLLGPATMLLLSGCALFKPNLPEPERAQASERFLAQPAVEREAVGAPRWGLALSGGGIRSGTVALGALKALYDKGILDSVDVISTVSGGGYTGYWLYSREYRDRSQRSRFGMTSFEDSVFANGVCDIATTGNMISTAGAIGRWLTFQKPARKYRQAIFRTFGHANYDLPASYTSGYRIDEDRFEFHELAPLVRAQRVPNLIVNANVFGPDPDFGYADGAYELTPFHRGTAVRGYTAWSGNGSYPILDGVAASGAAAAAPLDRTLPADVSGPGQPRTKLSDGGHAENLGAIALIRRRTPNILIVDATQDDKLEFDDYFELRDRLLGWGDTLYIEGIEKYEEAPKPRLRPAKGTFVGEVRSGAYRANVYYMKLSIPRSLDSVLARDPVKEKRAEGERERLFKALEEGTKLGPRHDNWDCRHLRALKVDLRSVGIYEIQILHGADDLDSETIPSAWRKFPHVNTFKMRINVDRTMAQVALGYLLGEELASAALGGKSP